MATMQRSNPSVPARSRSDSFVRMLELEKMCKMQRIQKNEHAASTPDEPLPPSNTDSSLVTGPPMITRSRRMSAHPPLSHQTQIMKAIRRGSTTLPSLSLSIPPPSPVNLGEESSSVKDKSHFKTVTFSEPEEDAQSETSSICQSPSWEKYGQKKKKKKKKQSTKTPMAADEGSPKRKNNRLSKTSPKGPLQTTTAMPPGTSHSVHDFRISSISNQENITPTSRASQRYTMNTEPKSTEDRAPEANTRSRTRGFLSAFRLHHSNPAAVQTLVERKAIADPEEAGVLQSVHYEATAPLKQPVFTGPGIVSNAPGHKRAPSIRSVMSNSSQSLSSQERRNSSIQNSTSSVHGRSQSLLSSTLNKLKGPSYLYYRPENDGASGDDPSPGSRCASPTLERTTANTSNDLVDKLSNDRSPSQVKYAQKLPDSVSSAKPSQMSPASALEAAPRTRQSRSRKVETEPPKLGQETPILRPSAGRRINTEPGHATTRDSVMTKVIAQERQSHSNRPSQSVAECDTRVVQGLALGDDARSSSSSEIQQPHAKPDEIDRVSPTHGLVDSSLSGGRSRFTKKHMSNLQAFGSTEGVDGHEKHPQDDDEVSIVTHASTVRPASQIVSGGFVDGKMRAETFTTDEVSCDESLTSTKIFASRLGKTTEKMAEIFPAFEIDFSRPVSPAANPSEQVDYFASFCQSYEPALHEPNSPSRSVFSPLQIPRRTSYDSRPEPFEVDDGTHKYDTSHYPGCNSGHTEDIDPAAVAGKLKASPATSTISYHPSDHDVLDFERLGLSTKTAKILAGFETESTSTAPSQITEPSRTTSERSSSSTCDDHPPSTSPATSPGSSRPQSRESHATPQAEPELTQMARINSKLQSMTSISRSRSSVSSITGKDVGLTLGRKGKFEKIHGDVSSVTKECDTRPDFARKNAGGEPSSPFLPAIPRQEDCGGTPATSLCSQKVANSEDQDPVLSPTGATRSILSAHEGKKTVSHRSRPQLLDLRAGGVAASSISLPNSPPADTTNGTFPQKSALRMTRNHSDNGLVVGGAYLQEARKTAPIPIVSSPRALRPLPQPKSSYSSVKSNTSSSSSGNRAEPLAKMLVECCNCHFFQDMPSRVYECMAKPDAVVEDKLLGVSAAITTTVKCPWCSHGMTTACCSGYAAVVYLKEKLHGK